MTTPTIADVTSPEVDGLAEGAEIVAGPFQALPELKDGDRVRAR